MFLVDPFTEVFDVFLSWFLLIIPPLIHDAQKHIISTIILVLKNPRFHNHHLFLGVQLIIQGFSASSLVIWPVDRRWPMIEMMNPRWKPQKQGSYGVRAHKKTAVK